MKKYFCNGKKDFCDNIENCSECQFAGGSGVISGEKIEYIFSSVFGGDYDLSRLRELVQADREGRCVVLPARIGSKVYRIEYVKDGDTYEIGIGEHVFDYLLFATERKNIGNTIFFTREAAEAALKEREKNEP